MISRSASRVAKARRELAKDILAIVVGALVAAALAEAGLIDRALASLGSPAAASFVSGIFFTSAFTIGPSSLALSHIAAAAPFLTVAFWGALGAMIGDAALFLFIRDRFAEDIEASLRPSVARRFAASFHTGFFKWIAPVLGALIISSPAPDEFGLALLGASRVRLWALLPLSFAMNWLGIYSIVWLAHAL